MYSGLSTGGGADVNAGAMENERYVGARGLPPEFIEELEREFGFDKPPLERFLHMMWNYMRFDFGESYFRSISVVDLVVEKLPVSITLGLWSTLIAYMVSIPLGIRKATRDGTRFDTFTSGLIIVAYAIPGFLFAILLLVLFAGGVVLPDIPGAGPDLSARGVGPVVAHRQGVGLPLAYYLACDRIHHCRFCNTDTADQELFPR